MPSDHSSSTSAYVYFVPAPSYSIIAYPQGRTPDPARSIESGRVVVLVPQQSGIEETIVRQQTPANRTVAWLHKAQDKLRSLTGNLAGCRQPPNSVVLDAAERALRHLAERGIKPARISPMADGGVTLHFRGAEHGVARVELHNEGEIVLVMQLDPELDREYFELSSFTDALAQLDAFAA